MKSVRHGFGAFALAAIAIFAAPRADAFVPFGETTQLFQPGGGAGDYFASSVAIYGDVAVASADNWNTLFTKRGIAYVFVRRVRGVAAGTWSQAATLLPSDSAIGDLFGTCVAILGDTIAVCAPNASIGGGKIGKIYVFLRPAGGWTGTVNESAVLEASVPGGQSASVGYSVAITPDYIAGGTPFDGPVFAGEVYIFSKPSLGWVGTILPSGELLASDGASGDQFGQSVTASGGVVVSGAINAENGGVKQAGKAYVFVEPTGGWSGVQSESAQLIPSVPITQSIFGAAAAIDGTTVVVTEPSYDPSVSSGFTERGYIFEQPSVGWSGTLTENAMLVASDGKNTDEFGTSASIWGDTVVLGSLRGSKVQGAAYVFARPKAGWAGTLNENQELTTGANFAWLGLSVSISETTIITGAPRETVGGNVDQGVAHVWGPVFYPRFTRTRLLIEGPIRVGPGVPVEFPVQVETSREQPVEPSGVVVIGDGAGQECRAVLDASGEGSCELTFSSAGRYRVRAHYLGNTQFDDSISQALPVLVGAAGGG